MNTLLLFRPESVTLRTANAEATLYLDDSPVRVLARGKNDEVKELLRRIAIIEKNYVRES